MTTFTDIGIGLRLPGRAPGLGDTVDGLVYDGQYSGIVREIFFGTPTPIAATVATGQPKQSESVAGIETFLADVATGQPAQSEAVGGSVAAVYVPVTVTEDHGYGWVPSRKFLNPAPQAVSGRARGLQSFQRCAAAGAVSIDASIVERITAAMVRSYGKVGRSREARDRELVRLLDVA